MVTEWITGVVGIVGGIFGSLTTGYFSIMARKYQMKGEINKLLLENDIALNKEKFGKLTERQEELFGLVQSICSGFSKTQNYRMDQADITLTEYGVHYEKMNQLALRAELIAHLYFPKVIEEVKKVCALTNVIWGHQQNYFGHAKETNQNRQTILDDIFRDSSELERQCSLIINMLSLNSFYRQDKHN